MGVYALFMVKGRKKIEELSKNAVVEGRACMGFNLKIATRVVQKLFDNAYKTVGLEGTQYTVLAHIYVAGPITLSKLANLMYVDRTTLGRNLKPLEKRVISKLNEVLTEEQNLLVLQKRENKFYLKRFPFGSKPMSKLKTCWVLKIGNQWSQIFRP